MNTKRRSRGAGAVYQRADGRWVAAIATKSEDGRRKRSVIYGRTKTEVEDKLDEARRRKKKGVPVVEDASRMEVYLRRWVENDLRDLEPSTVQSYRTIVEVYLIPHVGRRRLRDLTVEHVTTMLNSMEKDGKSPRTRQYARAVLRRALADAQARDLVGRNVAAIARGPKKVKGKTKRSLKVEEVPPLLDAFKGDRLEAFVTVALAVGLRRGEALGLRWEDIDLNAGVLRVERTLSRINGELVFADPKTDKSQRTVALPEASVSVLKSHRARQAKERLAAGDAWVETGLVFTRPNGTAVDPSNVRHRFATLCKRAGLGPLTPHELRHSAASIMLAQGVPLHVVSDVLGHSSIRITADVYRHEIGDEKRKAADVMNGALKAMPAS